MEVKRKLSEFLKRETVLTVAILLAIVSAVMIPPDREYAGYIDFRTLSILFCLIRFALFFCTLKSKCSRCQKILISGF